MMQSDAFVHAVGFTLREETGGDPDGGLNESAHDVGGLTRWGISQRAHPGLDIKSLTRDQAIELYRTDYWLPAQCDQLPEAVAIAHFDCAFNSGVGQAAKLLQRMVGAHPDGALGAKTLDALKSFMGGRGTAITAAQLVEQRARFLANLVDQPEKPNERRNLKNIEGWIVRLIRLTSYVSRLH